MNDGERHSQVRDVLHGLFRLHRPQAHTADAQDRYLRRVEHRGEALHPEGAQVRNGECAAVQLVGCRMILQSGQRLALAWLQR